MSACIFANGYLDFQLFIRYCFDYSMHRYSPFDQKSERIMKIQTRFDFDQVAVLYDEWFSTSMGRYYDLVEKKEIRRALKNVSGKELLEIGCGTGHWSKYFAALGFSVLGIDISFEMLRKTFRKRIPWAQFVQSNAYCMSLRDSLFDIAVFITSLECMREPGKALKEVVCCIRKLGGHLLVGTLNAKSRLNKRRLTEKKSPYREAVMLSPEELHTLLSSYGKPSIYTCGFSLNPARPIPMIDPLVNCLGRTFALSSGDLILGMVKL